MQISEVRKLKLELEGDIANSIRRLIVTFENRSNIKIDTLSLERLEATNLNDIKPRFKYRLHVGIEV